MSMQSNLIQNSFREIEKDSASFTELFYTNLFLDYPDVEPLFENSDMEEQGRKLFQSLSLVVQNLNNPEGIEDRVKGLGTRHIQYGVLPEHYPMVGGSLLKALELSLKDMWNPELKDAWAQAYSSVTQLMLEGTDQPK